MRHYLRRHRQERGAAAVEAAIIFPLLIVLTFGIIEVSLLLRDYVSLNSLVRSGTRTAATLARDPGLFQTTLDAMNRSGNALPKDSYVEMWVYRANDQGYPQGRSDFSSCGDDCIVYAPNADGDFVPSPREEADWNPLDINACPADDDADSVGILLRARHDSVTGLFFDDLVIADHAVSKFEPIATFSATVTCKPETP